MTENLVNATTFLEPGRVMVNRDAIVIKAVVGSAVAVSLWDRENRFGGMCHFIYPEMREKGKTTVKYGNVAVYTLIKTMCEFGSKPGFLEAQIFGGADPLDHPEGKKTCGYENLAAAHSALARHKVKIVSEDTGGHVGRKVAFNTAKNEMLVYKVERLRDDDWYFI